MKVADVLDRASDQLDKDFDRLAVDKAALLRPWARHTTASGCMTGP